MDRGASRTVPPGWAVLLAVVRGIAHPGRSSGLDVAVRQVRDWDAVVDLALEHELVAQLRMAVDGASEATQATVPMQSRDRLASLTGSIALRSLRMTRQLLSTNADLESAGLPSLAFKGPALSQLAYGDEALRRSSDLDILLRPADVHAGIRVLEAGGFELESPLPEIPWAVYERAEQEIVLIHRETRLMMELHWRIGARFESDSMLAEELFARADVIQLLGKQTMTLSRADTALALTVHACTHEWDRLDDVATLCGLLRSFGEGEWRALAYQARAHECRRRLAVGLCLARDLGGLSIPKPHSALCGSSVEQRLAKEAEAFLLGSRPGWWLKLLDIGAGVGTGATGPGVRSGPLDRALGVLWQARVLDTRRAGLLHLWRRLSTRGISDWGTPHDDGTGWLPDSLAQIVRRQRRLWGR